MGLTVLAALVANGATFAAAATAVYGAIGFAAIRLGVSFLLQAATAALAGRGATQSETKNELRFPTSRPNYRFAYGTDRVPGTPLPSPAVGGVLYVAYLVASRPTAGPFTLYLDSRKVEVTGDPYDFDGAGASAFNDPFTDHVRYWIGRGAQDAPPQVFLDECGFVEGGDDLRWRATDGGQGCTIIFLRLVAGAQAQFSNRWPSGGIPKVDVEGPMALVWDPRDVVQDPADASTWTFTDNHALCTLDAFRSNPFRPYPDTHLEIDMWSDAADAADEMVALKAGGAHRRYVVSGVLEFNGSEIEDLVQPIVAAGAARLTRVGGKLGLVPGVWRSPALTITESVAPMTFRPLLANDGLVTELRVTYSPLSRGSEAAELVPWTIPGAQAQDGGVPKVQTLDLSWVPVAQQAQRVRNIIGKKNRLQRTLRLTETARAIELVAGSTAVVDLPAPYGDRFNRTYEVTSGHPFLDPVGQGGELALRIPLELRETSADVYAWDPATDEEDVTDPPYDESGSAIPAPTNVRVRFGYSETDSEGNFTTALYRVDFLPAEGFTGPTYEVQERIAGDVFSQTITIPANRLSTALFGEIAGRVYGDMTHRELSLSRDVRVRSVLSEFAKSDWVYLYDIRPGFQLFDVTAQAEPGRAVFSMRTPSDNPVDDIDGVRIYRGTSTSFVSAVDVSGLIDVLEGTDVTVIAGDAAAVDEVVNGNFDGVGIWALSQFTIAGGKATHQVGTVGSIDQAVTMEDGEDYRIAFTIANRQAGHLRPNIYGDPGDTNGGAFTTDGRKYTTLTAPVGAARFGFTTSADFGGDVDTVTMVKATLDVLPAGPANFWVVAVRNSGATETEVGPFLLDIP